MAVTITDRLEMAPGKVYAIVFDGIRPWDSKWSLFSLDKSVFRRYATHTEARQAFDVMKAAYDKEQEMEPWTFDPLDIIQFSRWEIYDPNLGRTVAVFYDEDEACDYLIWRNKKQAKKADKKLKQQLREERW